MPISPAPIAAAYRATDLGDLERIAADFAAMDAHAAETLLDSLASQAIAGWRLADATAWQRVKFRARLIRASGRAPTGEADAAKRIVNPDGRRA